ncbi:MAG: hypothetical protein AAF734_00630 [Bacteroidota bacterium]
MKFTQIYRHGDVLLFRLPADENPLANQTTKKVKQLTLALGEVTGHAHQLEGTITLLKNDNASKDLYFKVEEQAILTHEEHDRIVLEAGIYLKINQVEYDPFEAIVRYVRD